MDKAGERAEGLPPRVVTAQPPASTWKLFVVPLVIVIALVGIAFNVKHRFGAFPPVSLGGSGTGTIAPDFAATTLDGPRFSLAAQRGHPVVLFFMAASCTSCLIESHALGQVQRKYGDGLRVALIDIGKNDSAQALRLFAQRSAGPNRFWVIDSDGAVASAYRVRTLDTSYIVDRTGRIVSSWNVPLGFSELDRAVRHIT
ncbi:MAG: hypothetical protein PVSMB7_23890 [Chloroflexota bacterium]